MCGRYRGPARPPLPPAPPCPSPRPGPRRCPRPHLPRVRRHGPTTGPVPLRHRRRARPLAPRRTRPWDSREGHAHRGIKAATTLKRGGAHRAPQDPPGSRSGSTRELVRDEPGSRGGISQGVGLASPQDQGWDPSRNRTAIFPGAGPGSPEIRARISQDQGWDLPRFPPLPIRRRAAGQEGAQGHCSPAAMASAPCAGSGLRDPRGQGRGRGGDRVRSRAKNREARGHQHGCICPGRIHPPSRSRRSCTTPTPRGTRTTPAQRGNNINSKGGGCGGPFSRRGP